MIEYLLVLCFRVLVAKLLKYEYKQGKVKELRMIPAYHLRSVLFFQFSLKKIQAV